MNEGSSAVLTPPGKTSLLEQKMNRKQGKIPMIIFGIVLVGGIGWAASQLLGDLFAVPAPGLCDGLFPAGSRLADCPGV